jgi:site-specific recombinase XerD
VLLEVYRLTVHGFTDRNRRAGAALLQKGKLMASISRDPNGRRRIQFMDKDGSRKTLRLGKMSQKDAQKILSKVEAINAAAIAGTSWDNDIAEWVANLSPVLANKLARVGLIPKRKKHDEPDSAQLGEFIDSYIAKRTDAKPRTLMNLHMFGDRLIAFFGRDKNLADIKRSDADEWVLFLKQEYAVATAGRTVKGARQFFKAACRADIIARNPFEDLKAGSHPDKERQHFVSREDTRRVIEGCPDVEWRLIVALSRFGGLRCPSEHLGLQWTEVDWERSRFLVRSPKPEHHEGKAERWVPIFPELRPYLDEAFEQAEPGAVHVIRRYRDTNTNLRTQLRRIIRRAGLSPWPKLFQNIRASRETELAAEYPLHVVCAWIGNSALIANKHYLQVTEADFERGAKSDATPGHTDSHGNARGTGRTRGM